MQRPTTCSLFGAAAIGATWCYASAILLLRESLLPLEIGAVAWYAIAAFVATASFVVLSRALRRGIISVATVNNSAIVLVFSVGAMVIADITYAVYRPPIRSVPGTEADTRSSDSQVLLGELYPRLYYPTEQNFRLHKPGTSARGWLYGGFYHTAMKSSPTLMESVLERHPIEIVINEQGFRDSGSMSDATIFALGDSFTFGWGVNENETWVDILDESLDGSIFNLGIHDASPQQELALLEHVLHTFGRPSGLDRILWMIYEGNDLEDEYDEYRRQDRRRGAARARVEGTLVALALEFPEVLKNQAIITKLATGQIVSRHAAMESQRHSIVDGVDLPYPLYRSEALGSSLFAYIESTQRSEDYVLNHPNRPKLERVFTRMASLAREFDFDVVVLLAPTSARLHGPHFEDFPRVSERPHFLDFVAKLAAREGFETVDLHAMLKPYADSELFYFRDDDHLNHRGNEVVARLTREAAFGDRYRLSRRSGS